MNVLIKICGLKTAEALDAALDGGADMVGFVFFPASPRHVDLAVAGALAVRARGRAAVTALTVDADDATLAAIIAAAEPDWLQLHGHETPERVRAVRAQFGRPVMKALPIATSDDLAAIGRYAGAADRLLFDAKPPRDATRPGGLGQTFDWRLLDAVETRVPFMLSGGLDAANVGDALAITRAPGVDVSSGVERKPGEKDPDRIRDFIRTVRAASRRTDPQTARTA